MPFSHPPESTAMCLGWGRVSSQDRWLFTNARLRLWAYLRETELLLVFVFFFSFTFPVLHF
jgi:hypothetical protein